MNINIKKISSSLLLRSFYLISIPMVLIQVIGIIIFFELHWDLVLKKFSNNIVNNIQIFPQKYDDPKKIPAKELKTLELNIIYEEITKNLIKSNNFFINKRMGQALSKINYESSFKIYDTENFIIKVNKNGQIFKFLIAKDRLQTRTIPGFFLWVLFSSIILSLISYYFIKNQIRPLKRLGIISRSFGRGIDTPILRPTGSTEIRELIRDFNNMKINIIETLSSQKNMLAGISHDLRTPLTRINLMIEELEDKDLKNKIKLNISEMDLMIEHYIDFIKNEKNESNVQIHSNTFIEEVLKNNKKIILTRNEVANLNLKKMQIHRGLQNIIDNANKFATNIYLESFFIDNDWLITIEDNGPGTELNSEELIKPFVKGKNNLNQGSGLGLSISKKIMDLNNGKIIFSKSSYGGLKIVLEFKNFLK